MPTVLPDDELLGAIEAVVTLAKGNESEAARRLDTTRLRINRLRKAKGGATPAVRVEMWKKLNALDVSPDASLNDTINTETIQASEDVPGIALGILRYMTGVIERDIDARGGSDAR